MTGKNVKIVMADDDPVMRLIRFALSGEGAVTREWVAAFFSPEPTDFPAIAAISERHGLAGRVDVVADTADLAEAAADASVILLRRASIDEPVLAAGQSLRLVQKLGAQPYGIDLAAAKARGVAVSCLPRRTLAYTAEHAVLLMLAVAKRLVEGDAAVRSAEYDRDLVKPIDDVAYNWPGLSGLGGLYGKTVGIVGLGEVGALVARRLRGFEMRVIYTKRQRLDPATEAELGVEYRPLDALLEEADYVSVHARNTPETRNLIDAKALARMKPDAVLVNTSRGSLVDEDALFEALRDGRIAGAGLDNHRIEPRPRGDRLATLPNVVLTPHVAGGSRLGLLDEVDILIGNCAAALAGGEIRYRVT